MEKTPPMVSGVIAFTKLDLDKRRKGKELFKEMRKKEMDKTIA